MRTHVLLLPALCLSCAAPTLDARDLSAHLDRLTLSLDALSAKVTPAPAAKPAAGVTCRDGKLVEYADGELKAGERALGKHQHCAAPKDYAWCIGDRPFSDVADACAAGKIDALLAPEKKP